MLDCLKPAHMKPSPTIEQTAWNPNTSLPVTTPIVTPRITWTTCLLAKTPARLYHLTYTFYLGILPPHTALHMVAGGMPNHTTKTHGYMLFKD